MRLSQLFALVTAGVFSATACHTECTKIACSDSIVARFNQVPAAEGARGQLCIVADCHDGVVRNGLFFADAPFVVPHHGRVKVSYTLARADLPPMGGSVEVQPQRSQPNGKGCSPVCYIADVTVSPDGQIVASPVPPSRS